MPKSHDKALSLSAITFNTWNCQGDYRKRLALMEAGLGVLAPDLLLLQEVFATPRGCENTARYLAKQLDMKFSFHPARAKMRTRNGEAITCTSGLAILSRHDIAWSEKVALPADPRDGERIAQFAEIRIGRARLLVVNLHLSHLEYAENLRRQQLERIAERVENVWDHEQILLGGDFNATEHSSLFEVLTNRQALMVARAETDRPIGLGVDHLFVLRRPDAATVSITLAQSVLDRKDDTSGLYPSDHVGIMATVTLDALSKTGPKTVTSVSHEGNARRI